MQPSLSHLHKFVVPFGSKDRRSVSGVARTMNRFVLILASIVGAIAGLWTEPALAQESDVHADFATAKICAISTQVLSSQTAPYWQLVDKAEALSGRSRDDIVAEFDAGVTSLRTSLFQRKIAKDTVQNVVRNICPPLFGTPVPSIDYDPAPPIAVADAAGYAAVSNHIWNCNADIPETLEEGSPAHTYRLRLAFVFDQNLRATGTLEAYHPGESKPFARYPLTGWPYRTQYDPGTVLIMGDLQGSDDLPDWANWAGFHIDLANVKHGDGTYSAGGQIDRRSDTATWVNLEQCSPE
jgi:hypothetical protein